MIEFTELYIARFLSFGGEYTIKLNKRGLVLVQGINEDDPNLDSNDAGKSNLLSAITWVLFERLSKTLMKNHGDDVVNKGQIDCMVSIKWRNGAKEYSVQRFRKHSTQGNSCQLSGKSGTKSATNEDIVKALGMTYEMFLRSVFWPQNTSVRRLTELRDSDYKELFDELVNTQHYEDKRLKVNMRLKDIQDQLVSLGTDVSVKEGLVIACDEDIAFIQKEFDTLKGVNVKKIERLISQLTMAEKKLADDRDMFANASSEYLRKTYQFKTKMADYKGLLAHFRHLQQGLRVKKCNECGQVLASKLSVDMLTRKRKDAKAAALFAMNEVKDLKSDLLSAHKTVMDKNQAIEAQERAIQTIQGAIEPIMPEGFICDSAGFQQLTAAFRLKEAAQGRLRAKEGQKTALLSDLNTLKSRESKLLLRQSRFSLLDQAYGPGGLRTLRLMRLTPQLNRYADEYSAKLVEGLLKVQFSTTTKLKGGDIREKYEILVYRNPEIDFSLSGGGMKRRADIIAAFALDKLRKKLTGKDINIRAYDEATDGVDGLGELSILELLREECPGTTLFVSHKAYVDATMFDDTITVRRRDNASTIEES